MNGTVARIVEIMFSHTLMTPEAQAFKDEVMNNCQERYRDLIAQGRDEDSAIEAVTESLKGMEEVIAQYPRRDRERQPVDPAWEEETFDPALIRKIQVALASDDVIVEPSRDGRIHLIYDRERMANLVVSAAEDQLQIKRDNHLEIKREKTPAPQEESLLDAVKRFLGSIRIDMSFGGGESITLALPPETPLELNVGTLSGDVEIEAVALSELSVETLSGDVDVDLEGETNARSLRIKTTSGEVEVAGDANRIKLQAASGDISYEGTCPSLEAVTASGEVELAGSLMDVFVKTGSGDVELGVWDDSLSSVTVNTGSGDLCLDLPHSLKGRVAVELNGRPVEDAGVKPGVQPKAWVRMRSGSGDVSIH